MGVAFLQPWVWLLAFVVAVPLAIHLLERERGRRLVFPSLRFLQSSRLSAVRLRRLQDGPLLAIRAAAVLSAVAALAGPVFVTPARQEAWARRMARAVVVDDRTASADDEVRSAAIGASFVRDRLDDGLRDAVRWLMAQPLAAREVVVLSTFRRGAIVPADLAVVPDRVGLRLVRSSPGPAIRERETVRLELRDVAEPHLRGTATRRRPSPERQAGPGGAERAAADPARDLGREDWLDFERPESDVPGGASGSGLPGLVRVGERLTLMPVTSRLEEWRVDRLDALPMSVRAEARDRAAADAGLRAMLRRGIRLPPSGLMQTLVIDWPGSAEALATEVERRLATPLDAWEPEAIPDQVLAAWERPVGLDGPPAPEDAGDRRLVWGLLLALLAAETWIRQDA